jgi:hypothetical protein
LSFADSSHATSLPITERGVGALQGAAGRLLAALLDGARHLAVDDAYAELAVVGLAIRVAEDSETLADDAATAVRFFMLQEPLAHFAEGLTPRGEGFLQALKALACRSL